MSRTALVMFAVSSLLGCSDAMTPEPVVPDDVRDDVGIAWSAVGDVTASGEYVESRFEPLEVNPVLATSPLVIPESFEGLYLYDDSPAAIGLLELVNTASADELDRQIPSSDEPIVGRILGARPFDSIAGLQDVPGVGHVVLDGLLQHALLTGYVPAFDHQEVILDVANLAAASGWDLNQSFGDRMRAMDEAEAERELGSQPLEMRAQFREAHPEMDWVALSVSTHAIESFGVAIGYAFSVTTNDPSVARFGTHYFVEASDDGLVLVEADFIAE